jgi:hypothetical protein
LGWKRQAIRCREPKIRPTDGAIRQLSIPTLVPGVSLHAFGTVTFLLSFFGYSRQRPLRAFAAIRQSDVMEFLICCKSPDATCDGSSNTKNQIL